jgi:hypothetical protein
MPIPKGVPDPTAVIPAEDLATLQTARAARLADLFAVVAEDAPARKRHPRGAGRIQGAVNNVVAVIEG